MRHLSRACFTAASISGRTPSTASMPAADAAACTAWRRPPRCGTATRCLLLTKTALLLPAVRCPAAEGRRGCKVAADNCMLPACTVQACISIVHKKPRLEEEITDCAACASEVIKNCSCCKDKQLGGTEGTTDVGPVLGYSKPERSAY